MSFAEQERVLFELLFDQPLRQQFCQNGIKALKNYALTEQERTDFKTIRPEALEIDAQMRKNLILARLCRDYPLSFSLVSSLGDGIVLLEKLIDTETMLTASEDRVVVFGLRLRNQVIYQNFSSEQEKNTAITVIETELSMAKTASILKKALLHIQSPTKIDNMPKSYLDEPVKLADYVSASVIPQSYSQLKQALCFCEIDKLWKHLTRTPLTHQQRQQALLINDPRLLIVRAHVQAESQCVPEIKHHTVELAEGFAPLLHHLDGSLSINQLLTQFGQAGAPESMLEGVRNGFVQLWKSGMLVVVGSQE